MKKIKNFIYLDNQKMYSISSQLFEGLTEYMVKSERKTGTDKVEQKGDFGSGKLMADIIENESSNSEKKFLHHYAYNLFEDELKSSNKILELTRTNIDGEIVSIEDINFVKVTGKIGFNDSKFIGETLRDFNKIGEAFAYTQYNEQFKALEDERKQAISSTKDRNQKHKLKNLTPQDSIIKSLAADNGMYLDPKLTESMRTILEFGYGSSFDVQMPIEAIDKGYLFSALLDRNYLTEPEQSIIKKYSRESEKEFTIFGIVTQSKKRDSKESIYARAVAAMQTTSDDSRMKEAMMNMIAALTNLENLFVGKLDYEYIIDPIAIYREI